MMRNEDVEEEIKRIEITEAVKAGIIGLKIRDVASGVIKINNLAPFDALLKLIPKELLDTEITDSNLHDIGTQIKAIRDEQKKEIAVLLRLELKKDKTKAIRFLTLLLCSIIRL